MPRRPLITLPGVQLPTTDIPRRRPTPQPPSLRAKTQRSIARIRKGIRSADKHFYAVGRELAKLDRPAVFAEFGERNFRAFLDAHVMPSHTAQRYMSVAKEYDEGDALRLGVSKAFHLQQYASVAKTRIGAAVLARRDAKLGTPPRRISELRGVDIQNMVRTLKLGAARAAKPKATKRETRVARETLQAIEELLGVDARVRVNKGRDLVRLELKLSDLLAR
ncbi:MAG: hypothetical protein ACI9KE_004865 [Polyangiales bacterium]|jgi:hypothetical protein